MEASVVSQPAKLTTLGVRAPLLRFQSDERLIQLIRSGDEAAFEALVQRYRSRLLSFCRHMVRSPEDAEDVLQEVFAASYRAIVADEREIHVRAWLYRIARNMCLKHVSRRRLPADGGVEELDLAGAANTSDAVNMRENLRQIVGDVRELPETQRTALLLREIDGLSYDQIALAMDTSVPGVKSLLVRARVALAEAAEGRLLSCDVVHAELREAAEGLIRLPGAARRHARHCALCGAYQAELGIRRRRIAAAFLPLLPFTMVRGLAARLGDAASGSSAGLVGGAAATSASAASAGGAVTAGIGAIGAKAAVAVATATLVAAGTADIHGTAHHRRHQARAAAHNVVVVRSVGPTAAISPPRRPPVLYSSRTAPLRAVAAPHKTASPPVTAPTDGSKNAGDPLKTPDSTGTLPDTQTPTTTTGPTGQGVPPDTTSQPGTTGTSSAGDGSSTTPAPSSAPSSTPPATTSSATPAP